MKRRYSLFAKLGGKNKRVGYGAYSLDTARRFYQNQLLAGSMNGIAMSLKPIRNDKPATDPKAAQEFMEALGFITPAE